MKAIFSNKTRQYILNEMCTDVKIYEKRILQYAHSEIPFFIELGNVLLQEDNDTFYKSALILFDKYKIEQDNKFYTYDIGITLSDAFKAFRQSGLLELYVYADTNGWEPLPKITKSLYSEMSDICKNIFNKMPDTLTIYRGTNLEEYNSKNYGQSWSLSKEIAYKFAEEYARQEDLQSHRVILTTEINKFDIYGCHTYASEELCIVNPAKFIKQPIIIKNYNEE